MGLEKEKKEEVQEEKIKEGGEEVSKEDVRKDVLAVMAEEREKTAATENLGSIRKQVGELKGELGKIQQGMYCSPDGKYCFYTPEALNDFMAKQTEEMKEIKGTLSTVVERVNNLKPLTSELPEGVIRLEPMSEEKRKIMTDEQNLARDTQVAANDKALNQTTNDGYRQMGETDKDHIADKPEMRKRFIKTLSDEERKKIVLFSCKDGECKPFREGMEKEEGIRFYVKDERGKFIRADEPEQKPILF